MRHKMTFSHFSKDLIRHPVSGGQSERKGESMKGEIRKEKGDLRSLMSSRLRLMVPCTEIYNHSAGAVLALVIVRSLWVPRA